MAVRYVEITLDEMEKFLKRAFRAFRPKQGVIGGEYFYELKLGPAVGIRVLTSVKTGSGMGARSGKDTIKVQFISLKDNNLLTKKGEQPTIVKRTKNWRDSIKDRVAELVEKYDDNEEWWEEWASTRSRRGDPEREMRQEEKDREREERERKKLVQRQKQEQKELGRGEEEDGPLKRRPRPTEYQREVPLERLRGDITTKQIGFIRSLLRKVDHKDWADLGLGDIAGFDHIPNKEQLESLDKRTGSQVIEALLKAGYGRRYATEEEDFKELEREALI
jgi:hypothetical protein